MSYTLRQVQTLLTKPELELFQASRANAIKELTERQLSSKITRTRTLRAKYRDLYQRQTVKTQKGPAAARRPAGNDNNRTEVKADVMQEVLGRFEERLAKLQTTAQKSVATAATKRAAAPAKAVKKTAAKTATKTATKSAAKTAVKKPAAKATSKTTAAAPRKAAKKAATKAAPKKAAAVKKTAAKPVKPAKSSKAPAKKAAAAPAKARKTAAASAEGGGNAAAAARGAVPTRQPAAASRGNPIKAQPVNKKIKASGQSKTRAAQAKRDSR